MLNYSFDELKSNELRAKIAARLHNERKKENLSLDDLAEKINYSKPTVQSWEKGWKEGFGKNHIPNMDQLIDLATLYNCTPEYLLCEYDEKTKQLTDICHETGLTEANVKKLQKLFSYELKHPKGNDTCCDLNLAFLNYFIENFETFFEFLFKRRLLALTQYDFASEEFQKEILDGHTAIGGDTIKISVYDNDIIPNSLPIQELIDYYTNLGYDEFKVNILVSRYVRYFNILSPSKVKQSDFAFSDTFLDIVKTFFCDFPKNIEAYQEFVDRHLNSESVHPQGDV